MYVDSSQIFPLTNLNEYLCNGKSEVKVNTHKPHTHTHTHHTHPHTHTPHTHTHTPHTHTTHTHTLTHTTHTYTHTTHTHTHSHTHTHHTHTHTHKESPLFFFLQSKSLRTWHSLFSGTMVYYCTQLAIVYAALRCLLFPEHKSVDL